MKKKLISFALSLMTIVSTLTIPYTITEAAYPDKPVLFYKDYVPYNLPNPAVCQNGIIYVPAYEIAGALELTCVEYNPENRKLVFGIYDKYIHMHINSHDITVGGNYQWIDKPPVLINNYPYIAFETISELVHTPTEIQDEGTHYNIITTKAHDIIAHEKGSPEEEFVKNLASETPYLIWVSKKDFKVRVFLGQQGDWNMINEFTCAIGKDSTPTCTGEYKYYERVNRWSYSKYYVGPIMRFNGGYAIHTTLIKYNGQPYDDRVGMKLSHGCVRLQPQDMNWLISYAPLNTKIYVTE